MGVGQNPPPPNKIGLKSFELVLISRLCENKENSFECHTAKKFEYEGSFLSTVYPYHRSFESGDFLYHEIPTFEIEEHFPIIRPKVACRYYLVVLVRKMRFLKTKILRVLLLPVLTSSKKSIISK